MELRISESCGSCIHTNKPQTPRDHAAHYEVAKTERWCFKHNCHVTRETVCDDYEGVNRSAKTNFTRIKKFNDRIETVKLILDKIGDRVITTNHWKYYKKDGWLYYNFSDQTNNGHKFSTKDSAHDKDLKKIIEILNEKN